MDIGVVPIFAIVNKTLMNIHVLVLYEHVFSILLSVGVYVSVCVQSRIIRYVNFIFNFLRNCPIVRMAVPYYIPISNV